MENRPSSDLWLANQIVDKLFEADATCRTVYDAIGRPRHQHPQKRRIETTAILAGVIRQRQIGNNIQATLPFSLSKDYRGEKHTSDVLRSRDCHKYIKMSALAFRSLCRMLKERGLIRNTRNISIEQKLMLFLCLFAQNMSYASVREQFHHSVQNTHRAVNDAMVALVKAGQSHIIMPPASYSEVALSNDPRYWPYLQGCIGAVDTTTIPIAIPLHERAAWRDSDGRVSQKALVCCDFDRNFTFIYPGMKGSCSDSEVLKKAFNGENGLAAHMPKSCYLLGNANFPVSRFVLAPYTGRLVHTERGRTLRLRALPRDAIEPFNTRHFDKHICIRESLSILKSRFQALHAPRLELSPTTQSVLLCASAVVHNFLNGRGELERGLNKEAELGARG